MKGTNVRVLRSESVGIPSRGNRSKLAKHQYAVAEYHGDHCYEVVTGTDRLDTAVNVAHTRALAVSRSTPVLLLLDKAAVANTKNGKAKAVRAPKIAPVITPVVVSREAELARIQRLHVRDINRVGYCTACVGSDRVTLCGKEDAPAEDTSAKMDALFARFEQAKARAK